MAQDWGLIMQVETQDIVDAIQNIEADIFEQTSGKVEDSLKIEITVYRSRVYFFGVCIWDSEDDDRRYKNQKNNKEERETIEQCLRRGIMENIVTISSIILL